MKKLLLFIALGMAGWYGYQWWQDGGRPSQIPDAMADFVNSAKVQSLLGRENAAAEKCITAHGEVIYGEVPAGIVCQQRQQVEGSLTVVPSEVITSVEGPSGDAESDSSSAADPRVIDCASIQRCGQFTSCRQARLFAENCQTLDLIDADRVSCMARWCDDSR